MSTSRNTAHARRFIPFSPPLLKAGKSLLAAVAVIVFNAGCMVVQADQPGTGTTHVVIIKQMHFDPAELTVQAGDKVEWKNEDIFTHTVTADDKSFDSGPIDPGHSWQMTFKNTGSLAYHCGPHPNMKAALVVQGAREQGTQATTPEAGGAPDASTLRWSPPTAPEQFHPILVNFTAALLPLALLSDILGRIFRRQSFHHAAWWMVLYAALITPLTAAAGWWWKLTIGAGAPPRLITVHQWLGTAAAASFILLAIWRWSIHKRDAAPGFAYLTFVLVLVLALVYQGSLGGRMVFGQ